ncbi:hypothetical protein CR203_07770 [Salipaludibacillus neizhouensis]|uniref:Uncharacterized protein n=1 Tax=Salipaludibacillus neizhouensis TaxID=885475 RepID=A0A3A9K737_9BACI|nr:hypothetical protein [Salipaludibacillus neizhouensis]RKL68367.1 hypothetical protein CR203_07770 [Salipaludibacillus neizhouensis]
MDLENVWETKETLREEWREHKDILVGAKFSGAKKEWEKLFTQILNANGILLQSNKKSEQYFVEENTGVKLQGGDLKERLESFLEEGVITKIAYHYGF